ncbi:MAG: hypothetical protein J0I20_04210 [Chloroflexi bacterium]|nr:hypothetical protein [Chloroflexota bacterium]OJW04311.1 MAG: hypothetical protein BGO39_11130 [Chloroflexi bacterium 54-19]
MTKFIKTISMTLLVAALAAIMAACGDATPTSAPANNASNGTAATTAASNTGNSNFFVVNGATSTSVPDALKAALSQYESQYPGSKAQAFKTSAQASALKDQLAGAFTKEGWQNITPNVPDSAGGFALAFTKGNKGAAVVSFPGIMANLGQNENLYIVFLPQ